MRSAKRFRFAMLVRIAFSFLSVAAALRMTASEPALDTLAGVFKDAPVQVFDAPGDVTATGKLMHELGARDMPGSIVLSEKRDPARHHAVASCDRDFAQPCPDHFQSTSAGTCAPGAGYQGPCGGAAQSFGSLSAAAKMRWSELCSAWWPCVECPRDFSAVCPRDWSMQSGSICKPSAAYAGPCVAPVDFAGYTRDMLAAWSSDCGAHWPCASGSA